jgi:hypothetical protein
LELGVAVATGVAFAHLTNFIVFAPAALCCFPFGLAVLIVLPVWLWSLASLSDVLWDALDWASPPVFAVLPVLLVFPDESFVGADDCCAVCGGLEGGAGGGLLAGAVAVGSEGGAGGALVGTEMVASSNAANGCASGFWLCENVGIGDG